MLKKYHEFIPKSIQFLRKYTFSYFKKDLLAGLTVGIVALPLAMAFAIASGVPPERGLYTAIIAGFLVSLLGGSRVQIGGPTGAFVVVVYAVIQRHGYDGLVLATFLAGFILLAMGFFRLGSLIKYIPHPLTVGFTTGIALVIFSSQVKDFFGLQIEKVPADFVEKCGAYFRAAPTWDPTTFIIGGSTLLLILLFRRFKPSWPWGIFSIVAMTAICWGFEIPVETISSRFGDLPRTLPTPSFNVDWSRIRDVIPDAITIALLAGIESLLCAVISDSIIGGRHKSNCELVAQGFANLGSIFFGGIPATAAIARTATNIKSGAETPVAGMIHAIVLLLVLLFFAPLVGHIPLSALAAVLIIVSWNMSEVRHFCHLLKSPKGDVMILLAAFLLTVLVDLTVAVEVGMILAAFLFMKRMGDIHHVISPGDKKAEEGTEIFEMKGPFFFGVADRLKDVFQHRDVPPKKLVFCMKHVPVLDATGVHALREFYGRCQKEGTSLVLRDVQHEPARLLQKFGLGEIMENSQKRQLQNSTTAENR
jgi:SulP family sulfate permease